MGRLLGKQHIRDLCLALGLLCAALALVLWPGEAMSAMKDGLSLCGNVILPSLFPFFVLSSLVVELGMSRCLGRLFQPVMAPLFRVNGACASAVALGFIGGYPVGARTAIALYESGQCSRTEAERLLAFCNNSNPVFLISVLGVGVFGSVRAGVWLWLIHVLSALLTGLVFRGSGKSASRQELTRHPPFQAVSFAEAFTGAVRSSLAGILSVCAFVVFFYVLAQPLTAMGGRLGAVLVAALELFSLTPLLTADAFGFLLAAAAGCMMRLEPVWALSDTFNGLMALPNLAGVLALRRQVIAEWCRYKRNL